MSEYEKQRLVEIVQGMDSEERQLILRAIPSELMFDELKRRDGLMMQTISSINGVMASGVGG